MNTPPRSRRPELSRRAFGRLAIVGGGALAVAKNAGATAVGAHAANHLGTQSQPDAALQKLSPEARARFDSMWQSVLHKHGDKFSEDQKARMRSIIVRNVVMLEAMYAIDVKNGDGPATVLQLVGGSTPAGRSGTRPAAPKPRARKQ